MAEAKLTMFVNDAVCRRHGLPEGHGETESIRRVNVLFGKGVRAPGLMPMNYRETDDGFSGDMLEGCPGGKSGKRAFQAKRFFDPR